jgi:hypothetical protein
MHLVMVDQAHEPSHGGWERDDKAFSDAVEQLEEYFAGERREFDLDLDPVGTTFQRRVWETLADDSLRGNQLVRPNRRTDRLAGSIPCGWLGQRPQSDRDHRSVSSGDRCQWQPHRLRRWVGTKKDSAGTRKRPDSILIRQCLRGVAVSAARASRW